MSVYMPSFIKVELHSQHYMAQINCLTQIGLEYIVVNGAQRRYDVFCTRRRLISISDLFQEREVQGYAQRRKHFPERARKYSLYFFNFT